MFVRLLESHAHHPPPCPPPLPPPLHTSSLSTPLISHFHPQRRLTSFLVSGYKTTNKHNNSSHTYREVHRRNPRLPTRIHISCTLALYTYELLVCHLLLLSDTLPLATRLPISILACATILNRPVYPTNIRGRASSLLSNEQRTPRAKMCCFVHTLVLKYDSSTHKPILITARESRVLLSKLREATFFNAPHYLIVDRYPNSCGE